MPSIINATTTNGVVASGDNSGSLQLATNNGTTAVTIDTSQNVGVGTTSPIQRIDALGYIQARQTTSNYFGYILYDTTNSRIHGTMQYVPGGSPAMQIGTNVAGTSLGFYTANNSPSMILDASGRLTTPNQPSFYVWLTSGNFSTSGIVPFNSVQFNTGSGYSTSTYKFTAPTTGTYIFFAAGITATGTFVEMGAYLNSGSQVANCRNSGSSSGTNTGCSMTWTWTMSANDTMDVRLQGAGNLFGGGVYTNFGGYLIG
jgi:hypothetical protein